MSSSVGGGGGGEQHVRIVGVRVVEFGTKKWNRIRATVDFVSTVTLKPITDDVVAVQGEETVMDMIPADLHRPAQT